MKTVHRLSLFLMLFALWPRPLLAQEPAAAEDTGDQEKIEDAARRFEQGLALFDAADFKSALAEFSAAYKIRPHFSVLYNIARCYEELHKYDVALDYYDQYLDEGGSEVEDRADVEATIEGLQNLVATVTVKSAPPGADIFVDGRKVGVSPATFNVSGGEKTIEVMLDGYISKKKTIMVAGRSEEDLSFKLKKIPTAKGRKKLKPAAFWGCLGATLALGAGWAVAGGMALSKNSEYEDSPSKSLRNDGNDLTLSSDILMAATLAMAAATLILGFFTDFKKKKERRKQQTKKADLTFTITPSGLVISY